MNRFRSLFAALLLMTVVAGAALAGERAIVPVAGSIAGALGSKFRTEMQMHNPGTGVMRGTITFLPGSGEPQSQSEPLATLAYEIGAHKTVRFADVIESLGATGLGSLDIVPTEGALPRVVVRAFDDQGNFGTRGLVVPVLKESEAPVLGYRFALVAPADFDAYRFNIGVRTLGAAPTVLRVTERDAAGATVGEPFTLTYEGETFRHKRAADLLGREVAAGRAFSFETISGAAFVYATTVDNHSNDGSLQLDRPVNKPPVIDGQTVTTDKDQAVTVEMSATDPDGDPMSWSIAAAPSHGTLSELAIAETLTPSDSAASVVYTPTSGYLGSDFFTIGVEDDVNGRAKATIVVTVAKGAGAAPVGVDDLYKVVEGETLTIAAPGVLSNDSDPDGDPLTAQLEQQPLSAASFTFNADGSFTYVALLGFEGHDYFAYRASDGTNLSNLTNVRIETRKLNSPPNAVADVATTDEDTPIGINVITNDTDPEGDALTVTSLNTGGTLGTVTIGLGGVVNYDPTTSAVLQALGAGGSAIDTFSYTIQDAGGDTDTATVTVTVTGIDDPATAVNDAATRLEDSGATAINVLANDADVDGGPAILIIGKTDGTNGVVVITGGGTGLTYQPNADFCGSDSFTYTITGGATATVSVNVLCVNDGPTLFLSSPSLTVLEDSGAFNGTIVSSANPGPANEAGQTFTFTVTNDNNALFLIQPTIDLTNGLEFTPAPNANGSALISVTITDDGGTSDGGINSFGPVTFTINVTPVNDVPSFTKGLDETVMEGSGAHTVNPWATALSKGPADESGQTLTFAVTNDNNALFTVQPAVDASGVLTYTLATQASGTTIVTVTLSDDGGTANLGVDTAAAQTFNINVTDINDEPSFTSGGNVGVNEDSGAYSAAWATAISRGPSPFEDGQTLTFNATNDNNALFTLQPAIDASGNLTFTLATNANGSALVSVTLVDNGGTANGGDDSFGPLTFTINVTAVNDVPSFTKGLDETVNEGTGAHTVNPWATALSKGPADESGQTLTFAVTNDNNALFTVQPAVDASGVLTYTLATEASGTTIVTVTLSDDGGILNGGVDTAPAQTFNINVTDINDAPSFTGGADESVNEDSGTAGLHTVANWATAISRGPSPFEDAQTLNFVIDTNDNPSLFSVAPAISPAGTLTYTLAANAFGTATITLHLHDSGGVANGGVDNSATDTLVINVASQNDNPTAVDDAATVGEDSGATPVAVLTNDDDAPDTGETLSVTAAQNPSTNGGAVTFNAGGVTYAPALNFVGTDTFTYTLGDGNGGSAIATVTMTVTAVNDPPANTVPGTQSVDQLLTLTFSTGNGNAISIFDVDAATPQVTVAVDSGVLSLSGTTGLSFSSGDGTGDPTMTFTGTQAAINTALNGLVYDPIDTFNAAATLTITTNDLGQTGTGGAQQDQDTVTINVTAINDPPVNSLPAAQSTNEETTLTLSTGNTNLISISDPDAGASTVQVALTATNGTMSLNGTTGLLFVFTDVNGTGTGDGTGDATMTFRGTIAAINTALDGLQFIPTPNYAGAASIQIVTNDLGNTGSGGVQSDSDTLDITVTAVNDAPVNTVPGGQTINEDATLTFTGGTAISVADDAGTNPIRFTLTVTQGTLSLAGLTGLTPVAGGNGTATMTYDGTLTDINNALNGLAYTPTQHYFGADTLTFTTNDLGFTGGGALSDTDTVNVTINSVNDTPTDIALSNNAIDENQPSGTLVGNLTTTDADVADTHTYTLVAGTGSADNGSFQIVGGALQTAAILNFEAQSSYSVRIRTTDSGTGNLFYEEAFTITLNNVNETPTDIALSNASVLENQASGTAVGNLSSTDPDAGDTFTYTLVAGAGSTDNGSFAIVGGQLQTAAIFDFETKASYAIRVRTTDAGGLFFEEAFTISVTNQNETPTDMALSNATINENSGANATIGTLSTTDVDVGDTFTYTLVAGAGSTDNGLFNTSGNALRENASLNFEAQSSYSVRIRTTDAGGLFYEEAFTITVVNLNEAPSAVTDGYTALGNTQLRIAVAAPPATVVAFTGDVDTTAGHPRTTGVKFNDTDPDTIPAFNTLTITQVTGNAGAVAVPGTTTTTHGSITLNADGSFVYTPAAANLLADSFTYTINDGLNNVTGTVNLTMTGPKVWYVKNDVAVTGTGVSSDPFQALTSAIAASVAGDTIYLLTGDGTNANNDAGPYVLKANQRLWGQGIALTFTTTNGVTLTNLIAAATAPKIGRIAGPNVDLLTITDVGGTEVRGLDMSSKQVGVNVTSTAANSAGVTIANNTFTSTLTETIKVTAGGSGTMLIDTNNNTINSNTIGFSATRTAGTMRIAFSSNTINTGTAGVSIAGGAVASTTITGFATNVLNGNLTGAGVTISNATFDADIVTGGFQQVNGNTLAIGANGNPVTLGGLVITTSQGNLFFNDLDIYSSSTSGTALQLSGTGTGLTFGVTKDSSGGSSIVQATNGPGVDISQVTLDLELEDLDVLATATSAVTLSQVGGTFSAPAAASIVKGSGAGTAFSVTTSVSGTSVSYAGTLNVSSGAGVSLTTNTGSTIAFTGMLTLSTGANAAFAATGGGTVSSTNTASTLTTTTGIPLNVANTLIGASGLTFQSISANGAANGIILNTTGTAAGNGGLTVNGTGSTDGTGGTIQNTSGRGAAFISAKAITLKNMNFTNAGTTDLDATNGGLSTGDNLATNAAIHLQTVTTATLDNLNISGGAEQGINGNTVSGFTLSNSSIVNAGNEPDEDGIHFFNMSGTSAITNTTINCTVVTPNTTGGDDHLNLQMQAGTLNLTISGGSATNANKGSGYLFGIRGTANATITFTSASSTTNFSGGIVADAFDTATMNLTVGSSTSSGNNDQLSVSAGDSSIVNLSATGNTLSSTSTGDFVVIGLLGSALDTGYDFDAIISGNTITVANGLAADGVVVNNVGGANMDVAITNNTFDYAGTQRAILVQAGQDGAAASSVTITGNNIDIKLDGVGNAVAGILAQASVASPTGDGASLCADIGGAGALKNTFTHSLGGSMAGGDIRARQRLNGTMRLPGYGGGAADTAAVIAFLTGRNTVVSAPTATADSTGFAGGAACGQPTVP